MHYQGNIIRPPSEADSILLQITLGCSHNKCTFCGTYLDLPFRFKDSDSVLAKIKKGANAHTLALAGQRLRHAGLFELSSSKEMLQELYQLLQNTCVQRSMFYSNHASNYLPMQIRLPSGKERALQFISKALEGDIGLKPEYLRAL